MSNDKPKSFNSDEITLQILSTFKSKHDENKKNTRLSLYIISKLRNIYNITLTLQCKYF